MSNESIIIVPGFWGDPSAFDLVVDDLEKRGHHTVVVKLPSWGCEPPNKTLLDDAQAVRTEVGEMVAAGHYVIVAMHSAGGFIAPEGLNGLLAPEMMASGKRGGVTALVYITAPCMSVGETAPPAPWYDIKGNYLWVKAPRQTLYSDLSDVGADDWVRRLKHHPAIGYQSATTQEPWKHVPSVYMKCANDATIPVSFQDAFADKIPGCEVEVCSSGHSPFLSQPSEVVRVILKAVGKQPKPSEQGA